MKDTPNPSAVRARISAAVRSMSKRERAHIARLIGHDPAPARDRDGLAIGDDDGATPELAQHADIAERHLSVTGGRKGDRRLSRLERLATAKLIEPSDYAAGERHHEDWAIGVCGVRERAMIAVQGGGSPGGPTDAQIAALRRWQDARKTLGSVAADLLLWCACEDRSWEWIGQRMNIRPETARSWTCTSLAGLAGYYALLDGEKP